MAFIPEENLATIPIQLRHDTYANFHANPVSLRNGEFFVDSDSGSVRVGHATARIGISPGHDSLSDAVILRDVLGSRISSIIRNMDLFYGRPNEKALDLGIPLPVLLSLDDFIHLPDESCPMGPRFFDRVPYDKEPWGIAYNIRPSVGGYKEYVFDILYSGAATIPFLRDVRAPGVPAPSANEVYAYVLTQGATVGEMFFSALPPSDMAQSMPPGETAFFLGTRTGDKFYVGMYLHTSSPNPAS